jgi:hypothetical protein
MNNMQNEMDLIDDEQFREQAIEALMSIGLPEDEAEMQVDDMF